MSLNELQLYIPLRSDITTHFLTWFLRLNQTLYPTTFRYNCTSTPRGCTHIVSLDRKSTRLNSSHVSRSYAVFCLKKKKNNICYTINFVTHYNKYSMKISYNTIVIRHTVI